MRAAYKLDTLSPRDLENLTFDLLSERGLVNLRWRTPGSDGGRDLEGLSQCEDLSGYVMYQKWFVECKHYSGSLGWPVIYEKVAHADACGADFLLVSTTGSNTPQCEDRIQEWNRDRRAPKIRIWNSHDLSRLLMLRRDLAAKYGLDAWVDFRDSLVARASIEIHRLTSAAFSANVFGRNSESYLEAASCLGELLSERMEQLRQYGRYTRLTESRSLEDFSWVERDASNVLLNVAEATALTKLRLVSRSSSLKVEATDGELRVTLAAATLAVIPQAFQLVMSLGHLEVDIRSQDSFTIRRRESFEPAR